MSGTITYSARTSKNERNVMDAVLSSNDMLRPVIAERYVKFDYISGTSRDHRYMPSCDALEFVRGGVIIPFDLADLPQETFNDEHRKRDKFFRCKKYVGRPDFFLAKEEERVVNLYPVDIKKRHNAKKDSREIKQISMYNSMHLIHNDFYAKQMVLELRKIFKKNIVLQNGFFIGENLETTNNNAVVERYLEKHLRKEVNFWYKDIDNLGLRFLHGEDAELLMDAEKIFESDMDCISTVREEVNLWNYLNFIKNRIADNGVFPCRVNVIQGFNGYRLPLKRLEYEPMRYIRTLDPDIGKLEDEIAQIGFMSPEQIMGMYHNIIRSSREGHLEKLQKDLAREIEKDAEETSKRWEKKCDWSADDIREKEDDDEFTCLYKSKEKEIEHFAIRAKRRRRTISNLENEIAQLRPKILSTRERNHKLNLRKYTPDWFREAEERRRNLIEEKKEKKRLLERQLEERVNGSTEESARHREEERRAEWRKSGKDISKFHSSPNHKKRFLNSMRTTDKVLNSKISDFRVFNYRNKLVRLADNPIFPVPEENYLYLSRNEMCQVLMYNALELIPLENREKDGLREEKEEIEIEIKGGRKIKI